MTHPTPAPAAARAEKGEPVAFTELARQTAASVVQIVAESTASVFRGEHVDTDAEAARAIRVVDEAYAPVVDALRDQVEDGQCYCHDSIANAGREKCRYCVAMAALALVEGRS